MNRYLTQGIFQDLIDGKHVAIVSEHHSESEKLFYEVVAHVEQFGPWDRVRRVNGAQEARLGKATVSVYTLHYVLSRGPRPDVVMLLPRLGTLGNDRRDDLVAHCAINNIELIATD